MIVLEWWGGVYDSTNEKPAMEITFDFCRKAALVNNYRRKRHDRGEKKSQGH